MARRPNKQYLNAKVPRKTNGRFTGSRLNFWLSAANYYVFVAALSIAAFFLTWGFLSTGRDEIPWITAGLVSSLVLIGAVFLREVYIRKIREQRLIDKQRLDQNLRIAKSNPRDISNFNKLTIEKNAVILEEIEKKSEAARTLGKLPDGHLEVFRMCEEYLRRNEQEMETIGVGSPRLPVLRKSKENVEKFHKFHLLAWASLESRTLIQDAKIRATTAEKLEDSQKALGVLDSAVQFYPGEAILTESIVAVKDYIVSVKVSHWIEQAERAAFKNNHKRAINHYRDALYFLARENERTPERDAIAGKINIEIEKLTMLLGEGIKEKNS